MVAEKQLLENTILPKAEQACGHALVAEAKVRMWIYVHAYIVHIPSCTYHRAYDIVRRPRYMHVPFEHTIINRVHRCTHSALVFASSCHPQFHDRLFIGVSHCHSAASPSAASR